MFFESDRIHLNSKSIPFVAGAVLMLLPGIFFRFAHLEKKLIWHDEVYTNLFSAGYTSGEWKRKIFTGEVLDLRTVKEVWSVKSERGVSDIVWALAMDEPQHPPLYYILAHVWVGLFGEGVVVIRALSAFLSLFVFAGIFWLCMELYRSVRIAWTAVALVAISPFFVLYAQEAREYALWSVLVTFSSASLLGAVRLTGIREREASGTTHGKRGREFLAWAIYSLFTVLGLYTSFSTVAVIIAQIVYVIIREKFRVSRTGVMAFFSLSASAVLFSPWALALYFRFEAFRASMAWSSRIQIPRRELLETLLLNLSRPVMDFWSDYSDPLTYPVVGTVILLLLLAILFHAARARKESTLFVLLLFSVPIALLLGPDLVAGGIRSVSTRYLTPSLLAVELLLAFFLNRVPFKQSLRWMLIALFFLPGVVSCILDFDRESVWTKGISRHLPDVARIINRSPSPLVVGNMERHNPGNMLALTYLLQSGTRLQFLPGFNNTDFPPPRDAREVFLFSPTDQLREKLKTESPVRMRLLFEDIHMQLWKIEYDDHFENLP